MIRVSSRADLATIADRARQAGEPWSAGLLRGAMQGDIALTAVQPGQRIPSAILEFDTRRRPMVVLLCGDVQGRSVGPEDFSGAWRAFRWASAILFHAAAGEAQHAEMVLVAAGVLRRILVIETGTARLPSWLGARDRYAPHRPSLIIKPRDDLPHPIQAAPAGVVLQ